MNGEEKKTIKKEKVTTTKTEETKKAPIDLNELSDKDMNDILVELRSTPYWIAIMRLNRLKDSEIMSSLASNDPIKEATTISRTQGMRLGLYFLEQYVVTEVKRREEQNNPNND
jgi:hypothetical protein